MTGDTTTKSGSEFDVQPYRFSRPGALREEEMEELRRFHRNLPARMESSTAGFLPGGIELELEDVRQGGWDEALPESPEDPVGCLFRAGPREHYGMLATRRRFAGACVSCALGQENGGESELSRLETRVFLRLASKLLQGLRRAWRSMGEFGVEVSKYMADPRGVAPLAGDGTFVHLMLAARCGGVEGPLNLSFPSRPLRRLVAPDMEGPGGSGSGNGNRTRAGVRRASLQVRVVLGRAELEPAELTELKAGDVVVLDTTPEDLLEVEVEQAGKLYGSPAVRKGRKAVKIRQKAED